MKEGRGSHSNKDTPARIVIPYASAARSAPRCSGQIAEHDGMQTGVAQHVLVVHW